MLRTFAVATALVTATIASAQNVEGIRTVPAASLDDSLPVTDADITDRRYRVIATIQTDVRKRSMFSKPPTREKIYRELWERARKLNADAVILATTGRNRVTATNMWGGTDATGKAIRWVNRTEGKSADAIPVGSYKPDSGERCASSFRQRSYMAGRGMEYWCVPVDK